MTPLINGMAIGLVLGLIILAACLALSLAIFVVRLAWWFATFAVPQFVTGWRDAPSFKQSWQQGRERAARMSALRQEQSRERAARIKAWGRARREKDLAWMERYWATRWCARLNRRLLG
jgi:hypothetical protein